MRLSRALKEKIMDVRLRDKLIAEGKVTKAQADEYLSSLEDQAENLLYTADVNEAEALKAKEALDAAEAAAE